MNTLTAVGDAAEALATVSRSTQAERRAVRYGIARTRHLGQLAEDARQMLYGECLVFAEVSEDVRAWVDEYFYGRGGSPANDLCMHDLFDFYRALISDVDIRYNLAAQGPGAYTVTDVAIVAAGSPDQ